MTNEVNLLNSDKFSISVRKFPGRLYTNAIKIKAGKFSPLVRKGKSIEFKKVRKNRPLRVFRGQLAKIIAKDYSSKEIPNVNFVNRTYSKKSEGFSHEIPKDLNVADVFESKNDSFKKNDIISATVAGNNLEVDSGINNNSNVAVAEESSHKDPINVVKISNPVKGAVLNKNYQTDLIPPEIADFSIPALDRLRKRVKEIPITTIKKITRADDFPREIINATGNEAMRDNVISVIDMEERSSNRKTEGNTLKAENVADIGGGLPISSFSSNVVEMINTAKEASEAYDQLVKTAANLESEFSDAKRAQKKAEKRRAEQMKRLAKMIEARKEMQAAVSKKISKMREEQKQVSAATQKLDEEATNLELMVSQMESSSTNPELDSMFTPSPDEIAVDKGENNQYVYSLPSSYQEAA